METMKADVTVENRPAYSPGKPISIIIEVDRGKTLMKINVVSKSEPHFLRKARSLLSASHWNLS